MLFHQNINLVSVHCFFNFSRSEKVKRFCWSYDISFYHFLNVIFQRFLISSIASFFHPHTFLNYSSPYFHFLKFFWFAKGEIFKRKKLLCGNRNSLFHFSLWKQNMKLQSFAWTSSSCWMWLLLLYPSLCHFPPDF